MPRTPGRLYPLLKWAGGKRQLLGALARHYPPAFDRYFEPFLGSGAVFFDLLSGGRLDGRAARLSDANPDLIGCYLAVRDHPDRVIEVLAELAAKHAAGGDAFYYEVRDGRFNPLRAALARDGELDPACYTPDLAAMMIYLNRTGFNGLFRLNSRGAFNVPAGRYAAPSICDAAHVRAVSTALRRPGVTLERRSFVAALAEAGRGDFVYCDPPYAPLSDTARFAHYTAGGFSTADQVRLREAVVAACERGAAVVVSNSSAPAIVEAYTVPAARAVRLRIEAVPARRAINSRATARGAVDELIISNVSRSDPAAAGSGDAKQRSA